MESRKKTALFYTPFALWSPHFETDLELIQKYLSKGFNVTVLYCSGNFASCEPNPNHRKSICGLCRSKLHSGIKWLNSHNLELVDIYNLSNDEKQKVACLEEVPLDSIDQLRQIKIDGIDIGSAALSSTITRLREPEPDLKSNEAIIRKHLKVAAMVCYSFRRHVEKIKPDEFIVFNGRFAAIRPALRIAQQMGIKISVHERSGVLDRYSLTQDTYPHDHDAVKPDIDKIYNASKLTFEEKKTLAHLWFEERRNNVTQNWEPFTSRQKRNLLPENLDASISKLGIFISSEEEFAEIAELQNPYYKNQIEGVTKILQSLENDQTPFQIFIRMHPNMAKLNNSQTRHFEALAKQFPKIRLIPAASEISTYALVDACDIIFTFGSTVGIEAVYRGKPSILMGRCPYEDLGGCLRPKSHEDAVQILKDFARTKHLPPPENHELAIIKYGLFNKLWGYPFEHVQPTGVFSSPKVMKNGSAATLKFSYFYRATTKALNWIDRVLYSLRA